MARQPSRNPGRRPAAPRRATSSTRRPAARKQQKRFLNYPRAGKGPVQRWLPSWRVVLGAFLTLIAVGAGIFAFAYATTEVPEPDDFALAQSTTVYYADGETPMGQFSEVDRQIVALDTLPEHVPAAVIASEDRRFYENNGVDPRGLVRALWNNVRGLPTQGGSTLTQQYVERYYVGTTTSYFGKFKETILALKIDQSQTKSEILENYLNTIYFGRGAYGIEKAAQAYFDKPASELTIAESALIAGIIPSPSNWDPAVDPERAEERWNRVMDLMLEDGWITAEDRAAAQYPQAVEPATENIYGGPNGYLLTMVRKELVERAGMTEEEIDTLGLDIVTTISQRNQEAAVQAVANLPEDRPENNHVALVSIDPATGGIVALYGGPDYVAQPQNDATQSVAQGGSTFKPFTLIAALENGKTLDDTYLSYDDMEIEGYDVPVSNYDSFNRGRIDIVEATRDSVNTVYAQMNVEVGPDKTVDVATRAGIPEDTPGLVATPSNVLGPASPHPIDTATAYATFAAQGVRHETHIVAEVKDSDGNTVFTANTEGERQFDEQVMADATYAMSQVVERGTAETASAIGRPAAGKTGSSNAYRSAWFSGYVPQLSTTVAMFQTGEDGTEEVLTGFGGINTIAGGTYPTQIWTDYMLVATEGMEVQEFPERSEPERPTYVPAPQPEPEPEPTTEEPTTEEPTEEPTTEEPTEEPSPTPTPEPEPETTEPAEEPTEPAEEPTGPGDLLEPPAGSGENNGVGGGGGSNDAAGLRWEDWVGADS
ncbi:penicillin-binding protein [Georgenia sp. EYE_87]|uniref:transglycosylase domain-containing protein n=1 Tax=Georgenia sp. EYE_87 TaxID=2853448 RepID=UPI002005E560|nr:transglycosylase domain-containing protein [Georgenia sp. EYE_87]MCK6210390.1 penicillin-binding protein [Georgenia sp. EYE_87]